MRRPAAGWVLGSWAGAPNTTQAQVEAGGRDRAGSWAGRRPHARTRKKGGRKSVPPAEVEARGRVRVGRSRESRCGKGRGRSGCGGEGRTSDRPASGLSPHPPRRASGATTRDSRTSGASLEGERGCPTSSAGVPRAPKRSRPSSGEGAVRTQGKLGVSQSRARGFGDEGSLEGGAPTDLRRSRGVHLAATPPVGRAPPQGRARARHPASTTRRNPRRAVRASEGEVPIWGRARGDPGTPPPKNHPPRDRGRRDGGADQGKGSSSAATPEQPHLGPRAPLPGRTARARTGEGLELNHPTCQTTRQDLRDRTYPGYPRAWDPVPGKPANPQSCTFWDRPPRPGKRRPGRWEALG